MSGIGTVDNPWDLATALASKSITAGDRLRLRGGVYSGSFASTLWGGSSRYPIIVEAYPGETPIIDGYLDIQGQYTEWRNIVFRYSGWEKRITDIEGSDPADVPFGQGLRFSNHYNKVINCVMHDLSALASYTFCNELYGCVMSNFGWNAPDRGHCHGIYTNYDGDEPFIVKDNISLQHYSTGLKFYSTSRNCDNYHIVGNTLFNNGIHYPEEWDAGTHGAHHWWNLLIGSVHYASPRMVVQDNMTYHSKDVTLVDPTEGTNCLSWGDFGLEKPVITGNYLAGREADNNNPANNGPIVEPVFSDNIIVGPPGRLKDLFPDDNSYLDWGADIDRVFVRTNDYNDARANVTVYNWSGADQVAVDLSKVTGLAAGDVVRLRNAQDYFRDTQEAQLDKDKRIAVDMQAASRTVATPIAGEAPATTFPTFGAFVLERV